MKKIFYILDSNGEFYSSDRTKRYKQLTGQALVFYLRSAVAKGKYFEVWKTDKYTLLGVEIPIEKAKDYAKEKRRGKYLKEVMKELDISIMSLEVISSVESNIISGEEVLCLVNENVEEEILREIENEEVRKAIQKLNKEEQKLIEYIFYKGKSERWVAKKYGVSQVAIHKRKERIFEKLKKFLKEI